MNSTFDSALTHFQQGQLPLALTACLAVLKTTPQHADAHHLSGLIYAQQGQLQNALTALQQAIYYNCDNAVYHSTLGNIYKTLKQPQLAILHLEKALALSPNYAEAYNNLASIYYAQALYAKAIPIYQKAIRLHPNYWEAHYNLANCYAQLDQLHSAIPHYETVLKLQATHAHAQRNLAMAYLAQEQTVLALPLLETVCRHEPQDVELQGQLAESYVNTGHIHQAITQYQTALALDPNRAAWHHNLAILYLRTQQKALAINSFQQALKLQPDNAIAQHMIAALQNSAADATPAPHIQALFDQYAHYYDKHMKQTLNYQAPQLLRQTITKHLSLHTPSKTVLDLGCGTGLCGIYFRDIARFLVGVDLSKQMLLQAKNLGAYDALCQLDVTQAIPGQGQTHYDLILASDVLGYIGALDNLFKQIDSALKPQGLFGFTIELPSTPSDNTTAYALETSGRFSHSAAYIEQLARDLNFEIIEQKAITLRTQEKMPICGILFILNAKTRTSE